MTRRAAGDNGVPANGTVATARFSERHRFAQARWSEWVLANGSALSGGSERYQAMRTAFFAGIHMALTASEPAVLGILDPRDEQDNR